MHHTDIAIKTSFEQVSPQREFSASTPWIFLSRFYEWNEPVSRIGEP